MTGPSGAAPVQGERDTRVPVEVAVGVLRRSDGALLFAQRPDGKPYAGWWEFPGGKLESGETVEHALARELLEELGVAIESSEPLTTVEFSYPHARVRLYFRCVDRWRGEPQSREGQALCWQQPSSMTITPLLPASIPVIEALAAGPGGA